MQAAVFLPLPLSVLSVSLNLTKEKVLSLLVKKFVESLVSQLAIPQGAIDQNENLIQNPGY